MKPTFKVYNDDSINILKSLPANSIDSLVTDPPAGIGFLNFEWDKDKGGRDEWIRWMQSIMTECFRVMKPGSHGFVWAIPRTSHWTAMALEDSGFRVKDVVTHIYGSGFPKNQSVENMIKKSRRLDLTDTYKVTSWIRDTKKKKKLRNKDIDSFTGATGSTVHWTAKPGNSQAQIPSPKYWPKLLELLDPPPKEIADIVNRHHRKAENPAIKEKLTNESKKWKGWGTALKPASEHWILIQKPIEKQNTAANVLEFRTGAINVDESRIPSSDLIPRTKNLDFASSPFFGTHTNYENRTQYYEPHKGGRFPANLILSKNEDPRACPVYQINQANKKPVAHYFKQFKPERKKSFFYSSKPTSKEKGNFNDHPTVKPLSLMRYLIKMITPPQGIVLDPFMGSGTTGVASIFEDFHFLGIEKEKKYFSIAKRRIFGVQNQKNKPVSPSQN